MLGAACCQVWVARVSQIAASAVVSQRSLGKVFAARLPRLRSALAQERRLNTWAPRGWSTPVVEPGTRKNLRQRTRKARRRVMELRQGAGPSANAEVLAGGAALSSARTSPITASGSQPFALGMIAGNPRDTAIERPVAALA